MIEKTGKGIPCRYCGEAATQEQNSIPVCEKCAEEHKNDTAKANPFQC